MSLFDISVSSGPLPINAKLLPKYCSVSALPCLSVLEENCRLSDAEVLDYKKCNYLVYCRLHCVRDLTKV